MNIVQLLTEGSSLFLNRTKQNKIDNNCSNSDIGNNGGGVSNCGVDIGASGGVSDCGGDVLGGDGRGRGRRYG